MKKLNNQGFALLETVIVSVFIISIFTFVYVSVVPLLGKYEELSRDYNVSVAYKLYHIRDAMYKDSNFNTIIKSNYKNIIVDDFNDTSYYNSLMTSLFGDNDYEIVYIRKLKNRVESAISSLGISNEYADYIRKIAETKTSNTYQNFIFLKTDNNYAYLGLAVDLNDLTNYEEPIEVDNNTHKDNSGANKPLLMDGMIPVYYNSEDNNWYKADSSNRSANHAWYNYGNFKWANVVLVKENTRSSYQSADIGTAITFNDIMAFYVWIPRYEYNISGTYGLGGTSKSNPGEISVNFIDTSIAKKRTVDSKTWRTATAFTFGTEELDGFWFAKFETSNSEIKGYSYNGIAIPFVLPEVYSWTGLKIAQVYTRITNYMNGNNGNNIYGLSSDSYTSDAHVMKNDEWGAVTYLSQSKYGKYGNGDYSGTNKEVYINNRQSSSSDISVTTGSSAGKPSGASVAAVTKECASNASNTSIGCYKYFVEGAGTGASTTGTIYGVYDMSGGITEFVMGAAGTTSTTCGSPAYVGAYSEFTGFKGPYSMISGNCNTDANNVDFPTDSKYYQIYATSLKYGCDTDGFYDNNDICYSHAMSETGEWYDDVAEKVSKESPWYVRGGRIEVSSGIFAISAFNGSTSVEGVANANITTRPTIAVY